MELQFPLRKKFHEENLTKRHCYFKCICTRKPWFLKYAHLHIMYMNRNIFAKGFVAFSWVKKSIMIISIFEMIWWGAEGRGWGGVVAAWKQHPAPQPWHSYPSASPSPLFPRCSRSTDSSQKEVVPGLRSWKLLSYCSCCPSITPFWLKLCSHHSLGEEEGGLGRCTAFSSLAPGQFRAAQPWCMYSRDRQNLVCGPYPAPQLIMFSPQHQQRLEPSSVCRPNRLS